ncbi:MAG: hypothetical protein KDH09_13430 [Chrysiogenetes bacterium]|nr:hypothetical protein [Chrysiogenetes bacterium]
MTSNPMRFLILPFLILAAMLVRPGPARAAEFSSAGVVPVVGKNCKESGVQKSPDGVFALYVFCDDAAGVHVGIVCVKLECERYVRWDAANRFWQEKEWASDVREYVWLDGGSRLLVGTSEIYGTGLCYVLDIPTRLATALKLPEELGKYVECSIKAISNDGSKAQVQVAVPHARHDIEVEIPPAPSR